MTTTSNATHLARAQAMLADLEARRAAGMACDPPLGSGAVEQFDHHIAAVRRLIARLSAA